MVKNIFLLLFLLLNLSFTEPLDDCEIFAKLIFELIQNEDYQAFASLTVNEQDKEYVLKNASASVDRKKIKHDFDRKILSWKESEKAITALYVTAREKGMNWKNATFESVSYKVVRIVNIETTEFYVRIDDRGKKYELWIDDCYKSDRGWFIYDNIWLRQIER